MAIAQKSAPKGAQAPVKKGSFKQVQARAISTLRGSGFPDDETRQIESMLDSANKRNLIFAQALLTSMKLAGVPNEDLVRLREIFESIYLNITTGKKAMGGELGKELVDIFSRNKVSYHMARRVELSVESNEVLAQQLASEIADSIFASGNALGAVPKKK